MAGCPPWVGVRAEPRADIPVGLPCGSRAAGEEPEDVCARWVPRTAPGSPGEAQEGAGTLPFPTPLTANSSPKSTVCFR